MIECTGSCIDIGAYTGILLSYAFYAWGPRVLAAISAALSCGGYLGLALLVPSQLPLGVYAFFAFCIGHGSYGILSLSVAICSQNESEQDRGKVIGALVCCTASTSLIFSAVFAHAFDYHVVPFFYCMAVVLLFACALVFLFVDNVAAPWGSAEASSVPSSLSFSSTADQYVALAADGGRAHPVHVKSDRSGSTMSNVGVASADTDADVNDGDSERHALVCDPHRVRRGDGDTSDESLSFILRTLDFWLLAVMFFLFAGAGLMWKNILGSLVHEMSDAGQLALDVATTPQVMPC